MLRVGVIGCGLMGRMHSLNCNQTEDVSVVAVADVRTDRAKALAEELNATAYIKAETMFEDTRLDAVVLASPPFTRWPALRSATS
ncbi:MAG: Gfo/Idh/MocA family oxidoreductase, partial [Dehalococcoidia bacterium]|nr:Gfo/Idh/MocA family oxidoreductase [Dehalococcoidia bacterium]